MVHILRKKTDVFTSYNVPLHQENLKLPLTHSLTAAFSLNLSLTCTQARTYSLTHIHHDRHIKGTLDYLSPEMIDSSKHGHGHGVDIWALGVLCYELINGVPPFETQSHSRTYKRILECDLRFNHLFSKGSADLITKVRFKQK